MHTVGEETKTYPEAPEDSRDTNFADFSLGILTNELDLADEALGGGAGEEVFGSAATGAGKATGAATGAGALSGASFRLTCIWKSPIYFASKIQPCQLPKKVSLAISACTSFRDLIHVPGDKNVIYTYFWITN